MKNNNKFGSTEVKVPCLGLNEAHHGKPVRPGKNLIQILKSFAMLPVIALSMPFGGVVGAINTDNTARVPIVAIADKQPGLGLGSIARSLGLSTDPVADAIDLKNEEMLRIQGEAIDAYYKAKNMPLFGSGRKMAEEAFKNGIDWRLLPAISVRESTGGKFACKSVTHSYFGWGSCRINFISKDQAIESIARNLGGNNPNTDHYYPKGASLETILKRYNSVIPAYTSEIFRIMNIIGDKNLGKPIDATLTPAAAV
jgi:hypothetical protein